MFFKNSTERLTQRNLEYLNSLNPAKAKIIQENFSVELRKKNRLKDQQLKRIKLYNSSIQTIPEELLSFVEDLKEKTLDYKLFRLFNTISSEISEQCKLFCLDLCIKEINESTSANALIRNGFLNIVFSMLNCDNPQILEKVTLLVANTSAADAVYCSNFEDNQIIETLANLATKHPGKIRENCVWSFWNLCIDSNNFRNHLIRLHFPQTLIQYLKNSEISSQSSYGVLKYISKIDQNPAEVQEIIQLFFKALEKNDNDRATAESIEGLYFISSRDSIFIDFILKTPNLLPLIMQNCGSNLTQLYSFKILGNIASSTTVHTQILLDNGLLELLKNYITCPNDYIRKECYFALSNVAAGAESQIQEFFECKDLLKLSFQGIFDPSTEPRKEAWHVFLNISKFRNKKFVLKLASLDFVRSIQVALSQETDPNIIKIILDFCEDLLVAGDINGLNSVIHHYHNTGIFEDISKKQSYGNKKIEEIASRIIENFYCFDDSEF